jgi:large subunit ribosomal protein L13
LRKSANSQTDSFKTLYKKSLFDGFGGPDIRWKRKRDLRKLIADKIYYGGNIMKTFMASPSTIDRKWYVVDATNMTLGRLASEVAKILRGKNKAIFTPHIDTGDNVIVINAEKIKVTGKKLDQKIYYHHSDYVGGLKQATLREKLAKKPEQVIELAVKGMLPKGPLGRQMFKKLHVYAGPEHAHAAQKPEVLTF